VIVSLADPYGRCARRQRSAHALQDADQDARWSRRRQDLDGSPPTGFIPGQATYTIPAFATAANVILAAYDNSTSSSAAFYQTPANLASTSRWYAVAIDSNVQPSRSSTGSSSAKATRRLTHPASAEAATASLGLCRVVEMLLDAEFREMEAPKRQRPVNAVWFLRFFLCCRGCFGNTKMCKIGCCS